MSALARLATERKGLLGAAAPAPAVPGAPVPLRRPGFPTVKLPENLAGSVLAFLFYSSLAIFILFLLTTFIHFAITPIFKLSPSESGILPITIGQGPAAASDWCKKPADGNQKANLGNTKKCDFTLSVDVFVDRAYSSTPVPRLLFYRADAPVVLPDTATKSSLASIYNMSNIYAYVDGIKNDLYICVLTQVGNTITEECVPKITNIPVNSAFRVLITYMTNYMEVYVNGKLQQTMKLRGAPIECTRDFYAPSPKTINTVKVGNLFYWPRMLSAKEATSAGPTLSTDFFIRSS
jgi:hypothetical protein